MKKIKNSKVLRLDFITIFPGILDSYVRESLWKRAILKGIVEPRFHNLREFSLEKRGKVDDRPFGGGPGMVLQIEPIYRAVKKIVGRGRSRVILFSIRGKRFSQKDAIRLAKYDQLIFLCGRYEGVDERVARHIADEEISIGDYVLSGGELPAMIVAEAVARQRQGFIGKQESLEEINGSFPTYTRPSTFYPDKKNIKKFWKVPRVLVAGDHKKIKKWRERN
ncbi:MAG: tRNA (guanosine(37)-N1)-methyltransferase TrmD [Candidatus Liptonbacteria bacterium]